MKALVHIDPETKKMIGVWVGPKPTLGEIPTQPSAYYTGTSYQSQAAIRRMAGRRIGDDGQPVGTWDEWAEHLAGETPYDIHWMTADMSKNESAKDVFDRLSKTSS
jgi:hypothetical protein